MELTQGDVLDRVVKDENGCWIGQGPMTKSGYVILSHKKGKPIYGHRAAFELWNGPIRPGFHVHHTCEVKSCWNPRHLRDVSRSVNQKQYHTRRYGQMSKKDLRVCRFLHGLVTESGKLRMHADF